MVQSGCELCMNSKRKISGAENGPWREVRNQLADMLTLREQGMITQREFEEKLEDLERALPPGARLMEHERPAGRTMFVARDRSGRALPELEFQHGHVVCDQF